MTTAIQPETRIAVLLARRPELEQRLMTALPALAAMQNEALRRSLLEGTMLE